MKRVLQLCFLTMIIISCDQNNYLTDKQFSEQNQKVLDALTDIKSSIGNKPEAQSYIIIDKNHPDMPNDWKTKSVNVISPAPNKQEILNDDIIVLETDDYYYIDVNLISRKYPEKITDWLQENDKFIKSPNSCWLIETAHKVQEKFERENLNAIKDDKYTKISWARIKEEMEKEGISVGSLTNYDRFLKIDFTAAPPDNLITTDLKDEPLFSFPLVNSIFINHRQSTNLSFWFVNYKYRGGDDTVILKVKDGNTTIGYYDFTRRPRYVINAWY